MPNVVVYVKARDAEKFENLKALAEFVREAAASALSQRADDAGVDEQEKAVAPRRTAARSESTDEVRTDFKGEKRRR